MGSAATGLGAGASAIWRGPAWVHRRTRADATLPPAGPRRLRPWAGRRAHNDVRKGTAPSTAAEALLLARCAAHVVRYRCPLGVVVAAHAARPLAGESCPMTTAPATDDFLSGRERRGLRDPRHRPRAGHRRRLRRDRDRSGAGRCGWPARRRARPGAGCWCSRSSVPTCPTCSRRARHEPQPLTNHEVTFADKQVDGRGKFEKPRSAARCAPRRRPRTGCSCSTDDVVLPRGFLDAFIFLAERFDLALAQPAHRWRSHAAWGVTRRRPGMAVRETRFVEIGPVCALQRPHLRGAAAVPAAAVRLGPGAALVGGRPRSAAGARAWSTRRRSGTDCAGSPAPTPTPMRSPRRGRSWPMCPTRPPQPPSVRWPPTGAGDAGARRRRVLPPHRRPDLRDLGPRADPGHA